MSSSPEQVVNAIQLVALAIGIGGALIRWYAQSYSCLPHASIDVTCVVLKDLAQADATVGVVTFLIISIGRMFVEKP